MPGWGTPTYREKRQCLLSVLVRTAFPLLPAGEAEGARPSILTFLLGWSIVACLLDSMSEMKFISLLLLFSPKSPFSITWTSVLSLHLTQWFDLIPLITGPSQLAQVVNNLHANAGDMGDAGLIPGSGRSPGRGRGDPLWFSCLENPMDRGAWWGAVHGVAMSQTWLKWLSTYTDNNKELILGWK